MLRKTLAIAFVLWACCIFDVSWGYCASFDCTLAKSKVEKLICSDPKLDQLDKEMGEAYEKLRSVLPPKERITLKKQQRVWIEDRDKTCVNPNLQQTEEVSVNCLQSQLYLRKLQLDKSNPKSPNYQGNPDCDSLSIKEIGYPQTDNEFSTAKCKKLGGKLCEAGDAAMGGGWSKETLCYKGDSIIGGIVGTYKQGHH